MTRAEEIASGRVVKCRNALTAAFSGGSLAIFAARFLTASPAYSMESSLIQWGLGFVAGLLYANAFEYVLHRFLLHKGEGFLDRRHALHHDSAGAQEEARYVNFARSPLVVVLVFVLNAVPVAVLESFFRIGIAPGIFLGFSLYFIAYEEAHWRIHFGPLPKWMTFARRHHLQHHGGCAGRYNVFLPLFDWLFHRREWRRAKA